MNGVLKAEKDFLTNELEIMKNRDSNKDKQIDLFKLENLKLKTAMEKTPENCINCDSNNDAKDEMKKHMEHVHDDPSQKCTKCDTSTVTKTHISNHSEHVHDDSTQQCTNDDFNYVSKVKLNKPKENVHVDHLKFLKGFKTIVKAKADGACLYNCTALYLYGNESKARLIVISI